MGFSPMTYIPHLCYHADLESVGACRLCMVEIEGMKPTTSCTTKVAEGMVVETDTELISKIRQTAIELIIVNHIGECLECSSNLQCELQRVANYVGIDEERLARLRPTTRRLPVDTSNPFFDYDPNKCIVCGICVRTCNEIQGANAIDFTSRGYDTVIGAFADKALTDSKCESCGECVVRCPVGALSFKKSQQPAR